MGMSLLRHSTEWRVGFFGRGGFSLPFVEKLG